MAPLVNIWPPRTQMALIALLASCIGAGVAMAMLAWVINILHRGGWLATTQVIRIEALANIGYGLLVMAFATVIALGMAINRRSIRVDGPGDTGIELSGGQDDPAATVTTVTETKVKP